MITEKLFRATCAPFLESISKTPRVHGDTKRGASGTTIFSFCFDGGRSALMAGDRMTVGGGSDILSLHAVKVYPVGTNVLVAGCGLVSDIQISIRYFKQISESLAADIGQEMTSLGKAKLFRKILELSGGSLEAGFILAGYGPRLQAFVRGYESSGSCFAAKYFADGSGGPQARATLDTFWDKDMNRKDAIQLAVKAMMQAGKRNTWTGSPFLSPLTIHIINEKGIDEVSEQTIEKAVEKEKKAYQKRHKDVQEQEVII